MITKAQVVKTLRQIRRERGDEFNPLVPCPTGGETCAYTRSNGAPSCVIGTAFDMLGVERPKYRSKNNKVGIDTLTDEGQLYDDVFTVGAREVLVEVQAFADSEKSWASSINFAFEYLDVK